MLEELVYWVLFWCSCTNHYAADVSTHTSCIKSILKFGTCCKIILLFLSMLILAGQACKPVDDEIFFSPAGANAWISSTIVCYTLFLTSATL